MRNKFKCANTVRDVFNGITLSMSKVIHRVNTPGVTRTVMMCMFDTVHQGIAHVHIHMRHVYLCAQYFFAILIFSVLHLTEELQVFFHASAAVRTISSWMCRCSF